jgi:hypothetical protein
MLKYYLLLLSIVEYCYSTGQIISHFEFDSNPVTTATVGPDASSISTSATSSPGGVGGTNGLNAGLPKRDIEMVIPGSPTFDVGGIDISFDYQRDENSGTFLERGQSLSINGFNSLSVQYRVDDGGGSFEAVNSGNIYGIPNDNTFRNYRFIYTPCDGIGMVMVDNVVIWMDDGPDNRDLFWTTSDDVEFGRGMDGTGSNRTMVDNLIIGEVTCSPLPVDFLTISSELNSDRTVDVNWSSETELNNDYYVIQRRNDMSSWDSLGTISGAGNSTQPLFYNFIDLNPLRGISYYRVKQVDFDGKYTHSPIASVSVETKEITIYPNPSNGVFILNYSNNKKTETKYFVYNSLGELILQSSISKDENSSLINLSNKPEGVYFVNVEGEVIRIVKN